MSLTLRVKVRLLRGIQAIVVRNDLSRQLGEVFLPGARKTYITNDPSTLFDWFWCRQVRDWAIMG